MWLRALAGTSGFLLLVAAACGDTYDSDTTATDAGADATTSDAKQFPPPGTEGGLGDAAPFDAGPHCDPRAPFTKIERVPGLPNSAYCARLTPDEHFIVFTLDGDTRIAERGDDGFFGVSKPIGLKDEKGTCASISADRTLVFYENFFAVLYQSGAAGGPYSGRTQVVGTPATALSNPSFDDGRHQLYAEYHLDNGNFYNGNAALGVAKMNGATFGTFERVDVGFGKTGHEGPTDANSVGNYRFGSGTPSADGLALYYFTTRLLDGGVQPDHDIWVSTRATPEGDFGNPTKLDSVNTPHREQPTWISPDDCRLYFNSNRQHPDQYVNDDAFVATRTP